ncbi:hypothetical protein ABVT39_020577 [Epinephelus coioides]
MGAEARSGATSPLSQSPAPDPNVVDEEWEQMLKEMQDDQHHPPNQAPDPSTRWQQLSQETAALKHQARQVPELIAALKEMKRANTNLASVKCQQLTQPASVTVQSGQRLTITRQVSYSVSGYWTHWIRQPAGKGLEWIGQAAAGYTSAYKDSLKNKFSISLDSSSNTVTLNGQNAQPEDTAVYYCAREPQ